MSSARRLALPLAATLIAACAQLQGLDSYEKVACLDDCTPVEGPDGAAPDAPDAHAPGGSGWSFRRAVTLTSDAPGALADERVLVVVPSSFDASRTKPGGDDLRFSTTATHGDDLDYFVESWTPGAASFVWVKVPTVPTASSTIYMFYGHPTATAASSFASTFPNAQRTAGAGAGSFTATGDINVDWFELRAGDTLTLPQGAPLRISARRVILAGNIDGDGRGFAGGPMASPGTGGSGPGGGKVSNPIETEGSGGGSYGGAGGRGGEDVVGAAGAGGIAYGTATGDDIQMGSGGASTAGSVGGAGGGALSVLGFRTTIGGLVHVNGGAGGGGTDRNGGGGAGGGILVAASLLDLSGATLTANAGAGGMCTAAAQDGGGGAGGGRIKLRRRANGSFAAPASMTVALAPGGTGGGTTAPGVGGVLGTTDVNQASTFLKGVEAVLGAEEAN